MNRKKVAFYYFSGTGNTLLIVREMIKVFRKLNIQVEAHNMLHSDPEGIPLHKTIGIAFPVACFTTYPSVRDFLTKLPDGRGTEIFMVDTYSSFSGLLTGQIRSIVTKKNYIPIGAREIKMPNNFNFKPYREEKYARIVKKGLLQAKYFSHDIVYGISSWKPTPFIPVFLSNSGFARRVFTFMKRKYALSIDNIKCIRCGKCYKLCPVDNIEMENYPEFLDRCQLCLRCISFCPTEAIRFKEREDFYPYTAVEYEDIIQ